MQFLSDNLKNRTGNSFLWAFHSSHSAFRMLRIQYSAMRSEHTPVRPKNDTPHLPATGYRLQTIGYRLQAIEYQIQTSSPPHTANSPQSSSIFPDYRLLNTDFPSSPAKRYSRAPAPDTPQCEASILPFAPRTILLFPDYRLQATEYRILTSPPTAHG